MKNNNLKTYAKYFTQFIIAIAGLLLIIDFTIHRHSYFLLEEIIGFPAIFGFICFVFIVIVGKNLRKILMRKEDYYDR
tara:strand:- start:147 stop:380 length:234 start_codon:yes stop_codon:yes gene_type:complete